MIDEYILSSAKEMVACESNGYHDTCNCLIYMRSVAMALLKADDALENLADGIEDAYHAGGRAYRDQ